ncbi:L-lactate dehydrogenase-like [Coccinella septempunctata]|uniref:L-lactate dehydrogenase-like n=1 Tax=Coccinella septempunctata TaxID=41139 RepID=UPI001D05C9BF|nr:L-lactate dehydrogenase-like [Coccinella septempunctata]
MILLNHLFKLQHHSIIPKRHYKFPPLISRDRVVKEVHTPESITHDKISIIGLGQVGVATAFTLLNQNISKNIVLVDSDERRLYGETLDLQQGTKYVRNSKVEACTDYSKTDNSKICIVTAGARQKPDESRLSLVQRNTDIMKIVLPKVVKYSPKAVILMVTNPVDVLTYVAWKISGFPTNQVIGSGTNLDSSRFRFLLSEKLGVSTTCCHGFIIGEHGDSSVALWSSVDVAGVRLRDINPAAGTDKDPENWKVLHEKVINSAYEVIKLKGSTCWAVALSAASIALSILRNPEDIHPISINSKGLYGIQDDIFLSLPCLLDTEGLSKIMKKNLDDDEIEKLQGSVRILGEIQSGLRL